MIAHIMSKGNKWSLVVFDENYTIRPSRKEGECTVTAKLVGRYNNASEATQAAVDETAALVIFICGKWVSRSEENKIKKMLSMENIPYFIN